MSTHPDSPSRSPAVDSAAAEWLVRQDRGLTPREQDEFLQWLAAAPEHRESFQRHLRMWNDFNLLAQWRPEHSAEPNPGLLACRRPKRRAFWIAPAAVLLAAAAVVGFWWIGSPLSREQPREATSTLVTSTTYRQQPLADGSTVEMNRGTRMDVQFSTAERRVHLLHGEAQFHVAKNAARPFVVHASGVDVRAVGTAFDVKLTGASVEVLVTEGTVQVARKPVNAGNARRVEEARPVIAKLTAGQRTSIPVVPAAEPPAVIAASHQEIARLLDWQPALLDFNATPLAEVVNEFNRRNSRQLIIGDAELQALPVVASVRSDHIDGFVRLLEATLDVQAERKPSGDIVLLRKR